MEEEAALGKGGLAVGFGFNDDELGEAHTEHFLHTIVHVAGPESDFDIREMFFEQSEDAWCVCNIANVNGLPRGTQNQPARVVSGVEGAGESRNKGGGEEMAAVHELTDSVSWVSGNR